MHDVAKPAAAGINGILIFAIVALVVSVVRTNQVLFTHGQALFGAGLWTALTTPGSPIYHAGWAPLLSLDIAGKLAVVGLAVLTLIHLLQRSRRTPRLAVAWAALSVLVLAVDVLALRQVPLLPAFAGTGLAHDAGLTLAGAAIWIPYFLASRRVKATFVL